MLVVEVLLPASPSRRGRARRTRGPGRRRPAGRRRSRPARSRHDVEAVQVPARPSPGRRAAGRGSRRRARRTKKIGQPAVGDLAGQLEVLRPDRGQVDRHAARGPGGRSASAPCPGRPGSGSVKCSPSYAHRARRRSAVRTISTYSRVRPSGLSNRTPCQPSETCGPDTPRPSRNRPPDSVSRVAAVIAVIAGVRAGICMIALPMSIRVGLRGDPGRAPSTASEP